jgi:hypothetical protein
MMPLRFCRRRWNVPVKTGNFNASASNHAVHHEPEFIGVPPPQPPQPVEIRADRSACTGWAGTGVCSRSSSAIACSRFGHKPSACPPERFEASALLARKVYIQPTWAESGRATVAIMKVASKAPAASAVITSTATAIKRGATRTGRISILNARPELEAPSLGTISSNSAIRLVVNPSQRSARRSPGRSVLQLGIRSNRADPPLGWLRGSPA